MKNAIIYVFSGTGNTLIASKAIKEKFNKTNIECTIYNVRYPFLNIPDPNNYDVIGFGYPIHAFNTPRIFLNFIKKLPNVDDKLAFIFKTSGEPFWPNRVSSYSLVKLLRKKGFYILMDKHFLMPYNIWFKYKPALAKQMYLHTYDYADVVVSKVVNKSFEKISYNPFFYLYLLSLESNG